MEPAIKFKKRSGKANLRKRVHRSPPTSSSDSDDSSSPQEDAKLRRISAKRSKTRLSAQEPTATPSHDIFPSPFTADRAVAMTSTNDATNLARAVGPVKKPTNVRTTVTTDFAPDVCKDYKKTGFCGFGDNCKYLHSREDYRQGWQLDQEWEDSTRRKSNVSGTVVASVGGRKAKEEGNRDRETVLESVPFACIICEKPYKEPIVTRCRHYFCEQCALKRFRKDPSCASCGADTNGVFNSAKELKKILETKRQRAEKLRLANVEAGDNASGEATDGGMLYR